VRAPEEIFRSLLLPRYREAQLGHFAQQIANAVRRWLAEPKDGLFISGPAGTGKTYMACAIVRAVLEAGKPVTFVRCADFYAEIRRTFSIGSEVTEGDVENRYANAPLLVLDDLAAGSLSDHERRCTLNLLDVRWNHLRPTVVTSNLALTEIGTAMDERISSRLRCFVPIVLGGRDRRGR